MTIGIGPQPTGSRLPRGIAGGAIPIALLLLGLSLLHYPFLRGPGTQIPGDSADAAFLHYVLEYEFQWLHGGFVHQSLWDAPFFYPHANSLAYSEVLLGVLPFYGIWRLIGLDPAHSYQLWFVSLSVVNFVVLYEFLRKVMELRRLPSALGAYFFAFASPRVNQLHASHAQLWAEFYVVLAMWFLIRFLQLRTGEPCGKAVLWLSLASAAIALQLISGFYFGWFTCFALLVALVLSLVHSGQRAALFARVRRFWPAAIAATIVFIAIAGPSFAHYRAAAQELNVQASGGSNLIMPTLGSWIYAGDNNLLYSWIRHFPRIARVAASWERANAVGVGAGILVLAGAFLLRRHPVFRPVLLVSIMVLAVSFTLPGGLTLWHYIYRFVPGAPAVRVVSRWGVFLLFPFSIALAGCLDRTYGSRGWSLVALLGAVVVLEQFNVVHHYDFQAFQRRVLTYARQVKPECDAFLVSGVKRSVWDVAPLQVAAMWTQLVSGVPTMNGYSGNVPPQYPFFRGVADGLDYARTRDAISGWQKHNSRELRTCWLRPDPGAAPESSAQLGLEIVPAGAPSPEQKFVRWSYLGIMGRLPRPDEWASAEAALVGQGSGRTQFILSLIQTPEGHRRTFVEKAYLAILGRDADMGEWWSLSSQLASGGIAEPDLVSSILRTEEYRKIRVPSISMAQGDAAEIVRQIESGQSGPQQENRAFAGLMYLDLLGRPPDNRSGAIWAQQLNAGLAKGTLVEYILRSPEYQALGGVQP
jgi:hypothetical protein